MRILLALLLTGCFSPSVDLGVPGHPDPRLQPQMKFTVDDIRCDGTCTVPRKTLSKISFTPPPKTHLLLVNTCARQESFWEPPEGKRFDYAYTPAFGVETKGACPMLLTAVTTIGTIHRGIVDFDNVGAYKPAKIEVMCNGAWNSHNGAYLCSVASGLPVVVKSSAKAVMAAAPDSGCPEPKGVLTEWRIDTVKPPKDKSSLCVYVLLNQAREEFRLTVNVFSSLLSTFPKEKNK